MRLNRFPFFPFMGAFLLMLAGTTAAQPGTRADKSLVKGPVVVYYDTSGLHAPFLTIDSDGNGHPDYVDSIAIYAGQFWTEFVDGMKLSAPEFDHGRNAAYPIYLEDLSLLGKQEWGYNQVTTYPESYSAIENDFFYGTDSVVSYQPNGTVSDYDKISLFRNPYSILKGVVYHELMHGVQRNYVTNAQLGKIWAERITAWCENRALYPRNRLVHANAFSSATLENMINSNSSSAKYGGSRFLALLEALASPAAVMEVFTTRARWIDSLGLSAVDDPALEILFFKGILARNKIGWMDFLSQYSNELARIFTYSGNGHLSPGGGRFPVERAYFNVGNGPGYERADVLPFVKKIAPLRMNNITLASVILKPNTSIVMECPLGTCHVTLLRSMIDSATYTTQVVDAAHPAHFSLPPSGYYDAFIFSGEDTAQVAFSKGGVAIAKSDPVAKPRVFWTPGRLLAIDLAEGRRARLQAWNLRGQVVVDAQVTSSADPELRRPISEGPLRARLTLLD